MKIEIYDTTLRDGAQGVGVEFSEDDRLRVIHVLDRLGVDYIEAGMITDPASAAFFDRLGAVQRELSCAKLTVFAPTAKVGSAAADDPLLRLAAKAPTPAAAVFGKAWLWQVTEVLGASAEENLRLIRDSVAYLASSGKEVLFDAEHFFDGWADNPDYAMSVVDAAFGAGASRVVLCDTNGGMLPDVVGLVTGAVRKKHDRIGIHCHNDMGMAAACSVAAVLAGACHVQGTVSGIGERCGNANLNTLIPVLQCKLGFDCIGDRLTALTAAARAVSDAANLSFDESEPFVGGYAFTHKAGTHIDGVTKRPRSFEHIDPAAVGNERNTVVSGLSGRAAVIDKMRAAFPEERFSKDDPRVLCAAAKIREREAEGFDYEDASASLMLVLDEALGVRQSFFRLESLKVIVDESLAGERAGVSADAFSASAVIKIAVGEREYLTAGEGNGPVNAIDEALRRALLRFYPEIADMHLTDYRVRVLDSRATASAVRVAIESTDGRSVWRTVGVSSDVINASWQALRDSVEYMLKMRKLRNGE
ncbi:MAG: citramalate synthase [Clostridia bacterium]|nr:citramalate synthase [Clostridia bacterium]